MRLRSSLRRPRFARHRSSRPCARCSAPRIPTGSALTRSLPPSGKATACGSGKFSRASPLQSRAPARRLAEAQVPQDASGLPDRVQRRSEGDGGRRRRRPRPPRRRLARRSVDHGGPSPHRRSGGRGGDACARRAPRPRDARAAGAPRTGAPARAAARPAPHHPSQRLAWRSAGRTRLAPPQDQAAAPRRAARCLGLDEPLHRLLRALPARRRRQLPRGRSLRLPHPPGACLALAARSRRHPRGRQARA